MGLRGPASKKKEAASIKFRPGVPAPPSWLNAAGKAEYIRAAAELEAADGALQQVDLAALANYAQAYADVARLMVKIRREGEVTAGVQGPVTNPRIRALAGAQRMLLASMAKLGFSPADRARVPKSAATGKPDNAFASFVK